MDHMMDMMDGPTVTVTDPAVQVIADMVQCLSIAETASLRGNLEAIHRCGLAIGSACTGPSAATIAEHLVCAAAQAPSIGAAFACEQAALTMGNRCLSSQSVVHDRPALFTCHES